MGYSPWSCKGIGHNLVTKQQRGTWCVLCTGTPDLRSQQQQGGHLVPQHLLTPSLITLPPAHVPPETDFKKKKKKKN